MAKEKRKVRLTAATVNNPDTNEKEVWFRATTKLGNKSIAVNGPDEASALRALQDKVATEEARAAVRATLPKTVEVAW